MVVLPLIIKKFSSLREYGIILCKLPPFGIICLIILIHILIELFTTCRSSHTFCLFLFDNITWKLGQYRDHLLNHTQEKNGGTDAKPGSQKSPCYLSCIWVLNFCHTPWTLLVFQIFILIYYGTVSGLDQIAYLISTNWPICLELTSSKHICLLRVPVILKRFSKNFHQGQW